MDEKRKAEIALVLWKHRLARQSITFDSLKRELGNIAKETGIPLEELKVFLRSLIEEIVQETFEKARVRVLED